MLAVRRQERRQVGGQRRATGRRALRVLEHCSRTEQGLLRDDRLPQEHGLAAHDELGGAAVSHAPGHHTARAAARGRVAPRTGPSRPRQRRKHLLGKHRQK